LEANRRYEHWLSRMERRPEDGYPIKYPEGKTIQEVIKPRWVYKVSKKEP